MIIREKYLNDIRPFYDSDLIKVITGIRRSGKSTLLGQIIDEISIKSKNIIYINFEDLQYSHIQNCNDLNEYILERIKGNKKYYLFFDEIQKVDAWEKVVNSLKATKKEKVSIFITGSNSDLLSGELATLLSGRYVSFQIYPFCFREMCLLKNDNHYDNLFQNFLKWGGMPQRFEFSKEEQVRVYLSDVYDSIVMKDIINRFKIADIDLFNRVVLYIMTNPSQTFSVDNIVNYFKNHDNRVVSKETVYNYLDYMCKAFLIQKAERYDVRGKRILNGKYKYYLTDLGLGQVLNVSKKEQLGAYLENVVYNELIIRGYDVKIGTFDQGEVDFVALKDGNRIYFQVAYLLATEEVIKREFGAFDHLVNHYPKYVLSLDNFDFSQNGIIHKNIIDWLLNE